MEREIVLDLLSLDATYLETEASHQKYDEPSHREHPLSSSLRLKLARAIAVLWLPASERKLPRDPEYFRLSDKLWQHLLSCQKSISIPSPNTLGDLWIPSPLNHWGHLPSIYRSNQRAGTGSVGLGMERLYGKELFKGKAFVQDSESNSRDLLGSKVGSDKVMEDPVAI